MSVDSFVSGSGEGLSRRGRTVLLPSIEETVLKTINVSRKFYEDHVARDCPAPVAVRTMRHLVAIEVVQDAGWWDLLSDAVYYSDIDGFDDDGIPAAARTVAAKMRAATAEVEAAAAARRCVTGRCGHEAYDADCADYVALACCGRVEHVDDVYADDVCDDCFGFVPDGVEMRMVDGFLMQVVR